MPSEALHIAKTCVLWASVSMVIYLVLNPALSGLFLFPLNLSFLTLPSLVLIALLSVSSLARLSIRGKPWSGAVRRGLNGLALFIFLTLLFRELPSYAGVLAAAFYPTQLIVISCTGAAVGGELYKVRRRLGLILKAVSVVVLGYGLHSLLNYWLLDLSLTRKLPSAWTLVSYMSLPLLVGSIAYAVGILIGLFKDTRHPSVSALLTWLSEGSPRNFSLAFFLSLYLLYLRPYISERVPLIVVLEWIAVSLTVATVFISFKSLSEPLYVDLGFADWKKHVQRVQRQEGKAFLRALHLQKSFLDYGTKAPFLVHCISTLKDLGVPEARVADVVKPLIAYKERKPVWIALPWVKKKIRKDNREARKRIVENLAKALAREAHA